MVSEEIQSHLDSSLAQTHPHNIDGVGMCLINLNHIFDHLASLSNLKCKTKQPQKTNRGQRFDSDCKTIRKILRNVSNQKHRNPDSQELRLKYCETLKLHKNTLRAKKQHSQKQLEITEESLRSNEFWENWNLITKKCYHEQAIQNGDTWKNHFEALYKKPPKTRAQEQISEKQKDLEGGGKNCQGPHDNPITQLELENKLKAVQPKNACGPDGIFNETGHPKDIQPAATCGSFP